MKRAFVSLCLGALLLTGGDVRAGTFVPGDNPLLPARPLGGKDAWLAQIGGQPRKGDPATPKKEEKKEEEKPGAPQAVNPKKVMLYSLLLPGLGQQMAGRDQRARVYYGIEAAIWTAWVVNRLEGSARKDRFIEFAQLEAGVGAGKADDEYWRTIALFERSDPGPGSANEYVRRMARALYPGDRAAQEKYLEENGYFGDRAWDWGGTDDLQRYRSLRSQSLDAYHRAEYSIGLAIVHRLVSMVDAVLVARQANKAHAPGVEQGATEPRGRFGLAFMDDGDHHVPVLTYRMSF